MKILNIKQIRIDKIRIDDFDENYNNLKILVMR